MQKMVFRLVFTLLMVCNIHHYAWAYTPPSQSPMARRLHPRLHITPDTLPALRTAIATHYADQFQTYVNWVAAEGNTNEDAKFNRISDADHSLIRALMVHQAFISVLGPVPGITYPISLEEFARKAITRLLSQLHSGYQVSYVAALVYDWTFHQMTPAERAESASLLASAKNKHNDSKLNLTLTTPEFEPDLLLSSYYYESFHPWYLGLALWGDGFVDAAADRAVNTFRPLMLNYGHLDAINFMAGQGGGWDEWIGYSNWHPRSHALRIDAWRTATGEDYIAGPGTVAGNALKHYPKFMHYAVDPHKYHNTTYTYVMMGGAQTTDSIITGNRSQNALLFFLPRTLAASGLNTEAGLVRHFLDLYEQDWVSQYDEFDLWGFLGVPRAVASVTPQQAGLPKSNWSENIGLFIARTGFTSHADGVFFVTDGHFGATLKRGVQKWPGFGLTRFGPLVGTRSVGHRSIGNLSSYQDGYEMNIVYFEGGHKQERDDLKNRSHLRQIVNGQGAFDTGGIEQIVTRDGVFYHVRVNRSRSFVDGVQHHREYVWLPGANPVTDSDFLVVYDRTVAPSKPQWVYHVPWKPEVSGHTTTADLALGSGLTGRIGTAYEGPNLLVKELNSIGDERDNYKGTTNYTGGAGAHGVMYARTLLPKTARIEVSRVAELDKNVVMRQGDLAIKAHRWQVGVKPLEDRSEHRFLHVFETADAHVKSAMTQTTLLETSNAAEGVFISGLSPQQANFAVVFNKLGGNTTAMQYSLTGQGNVRHVITGLLPGATYRIEEVAGENLVLTKTAEQGRQWDYRGVDTNRATGTLFFEAPLSGAHTYRLTHLGSATDQTPPAPPSLLRSTP
jgi:hypothetical protein